MAAEVVGSAQLEIVRQIFERLTNSKAKKAATTAAKFVFWEDGMLKELRAIADGKVDLATIAKLREKFEDSEHRVSQAIKALLYMRNALGATRVAQQIDEVVNSTN